MTDYRALACALALGLMLGPAGALAKDAGPTGLELQQIQSRDYEAKFDVVFPAVMTVLQDAGYRINAADKATGLITGQASTESKLDYNLMWGWGKAKKTPIISAFIEPRGPNVSRVRLNFVLSKTKSRIYGMSTADEEAITDPTAYREAFELIDKEIFVRLAMDNPASAAAAREIAAPPTPAPAVVKRAPEPAPTPVRATNASPAKPVQAKQGGCGGIRVVGAPDALRC